MSLYLLDTDHISLIQRGHTKVVARYHATPEQELFVSVISFEEQLRGWMKVISQAGKPEHLLRGYRSLREMQIFFCRMRMLDFDARANAVYTLLRQKHRRLGAMDLRIAATARWTRFS